MGTEQYFWLESIVVKYKCRLSIVSEYVGTSAAVSFIGNHKTLHLIWEKVDFLHHCRFVGIS